jgi:DNA-binding NtrC family response regulator
MSGGCPIELEHLSIANSDTKSDVFSIGSEQRARLERVLKDDSINQRASVTKQSAESGLPFADRFKHEVIDLERKIIIEALQRCAGNQTRASKMLGISRRTLIKRLNEYKIEYGRRRKKSLV